MALSTTEFLRGNWDKSLEYADAGWSTEAPRHVQAMSIAARFRVRAYYGDRESALALLNQYPEMLAQPGKMNIYGSLVLSLAAVEGLFVLGELEQAAIAYPVIRELIDTGTICLPMICRFSQTAAGIAATAARNWAAAGNHFRIAMRQAESYPNVVEQADIRRFHAVMLLDRAATGDREKARTLLKEALETYERIGMPRHWEITQTLLNGAADR
jgi:tetratricopeptide (TPR) repeat protein